MRVLHVITRLIVGGAQENTVASVLGLRRQFGWEVELLSGPTRGPEGSLESTLADSPGVLTLIPDLVRPVHPWRDLRALRQLTRLFRARQPDLVHTHSGKAGVLGRLAAARAGVPVIVHTIHGPSFGPFQNPLANLVFRTAERLAARVTTHFVSVAEAMTQQYLAAGIGHPGQYSTIRSGFDLRPYQAARNEPAVRARWGIPRDALVIGKIARLFKLKGHEDLFAVAPALVAQCPRLKFLLVGDGPWRARFERQLESLGLRPSFVFTGLVSPAEIPALVGIMDMLVHLSRREGLPRALPQALAAARPVVAYDCDGAREVCRDGQTGFLIPVGDRDRLTARLLELARDPELRQRLGQAGQSLVVSEFDVDRMVRSLHDLYLRLADQRQSRPLVE